MSMPQNIIDSQTILNNYKYKNVCESLQKKKIIDSKSHEKTNPKKKYKKIDVSKSTYKTFIVNNQSNKDIFLKSIIKFIKYLIIINLIYPIVSLYNISLVIIEIKNYDYYPILNTRYIGKPMKIYFNDCLTNEDYDFKYENDYLFIRTNDNFVNIVLSWDNSIGETVTDEFSKELFSTEEIMSDKTYLISKKENSIYVTDLIPKNKNIKFSREIPVDENKIEEINIITATNKEKRFKGDISNKVVTEKLSRNENLNQRILEEQTFYLNNKKKPTSQIIDSQINIKVSDEENTNPHHYEKIT